MATSTSDNVVELGPDEFPFYSQEVVAPEPEKEKQDFGGPGSKVDSDTVDGLQTSRAVTRSPGTLIPLGTDGKFPTGAVPYKSGSVVQKVYSFDGAVASGTTTIPYDDTIPQNTEGNQFLTVTITPTSATNILVIESIVYLSFSGVNRAISALFQDSTANALAVAFGGVVDATDFMEEVSLRWKMVAGTTSATTFKIRAGGNGAATCYINGDAATGARKFGGAMASHIIVTEYQA